MKRFNTLADVAPPQAVPDNVQLVRETPPQTMAQLLGATVLSLGAGFTVLIGMALVAIGFELPWRVPFAAAGLAMIAAAITSFMMLDSLLITRETITGTAFVPPPPEMQQMVTVEVIDPEHNRVGYFDVPGGTDALYKLACGLLAGRTFSEAEWTGAGQPYSRGEFRKLRGELLERGLIIWRNPRAPAQGVELTLAGRHVFARIAEQSHAPRAHAGTGPQILIPPQPGEGSSDGP